MGWILGPYEKGAPARFADGVPDWFGRSLFPGDLDRLVPHIEAAMRRVPALENCGIKDIVNGPISYTPDGSPLIGPAWGVRNVWLNEGHSFGITAAGGSGWQLAEWITEGEPGIDMLATDPRRFGAYASKRYVVTKNEETYRNVFTVHFPDEEREDARPAKTSPVYDKIDAWARSGASATAGSAPTGSRPRAWNARIAGASGAPTTSSTWATSQAHAREGRRHRSHPFSKFEVSGPGRGSLARWPGGQQGPEQGRPHGAVPRAHQAGGIRSEFTITKIADQHFYVVSAGAAERYDSDYLAKALPATDRCRCATSPTPEAASCWRARSRARCSRNSPTRRSTTPPSPGSPRRRSRRAWQWMSMRCA